MFLKVRRLERLRVICGLSLVFFKLILLIYRTHNALNLLAKTTHLLKHYSLHPGFHYFRYSLKFQNLP